MRRRDKLKNIERANLLAEQRHLESKGLLTEGTESTNWDEVLTRNLTDPSSDLFTFDFNGKRTTLRVTRVNKISFDNIKFLHIDVQLEPNNIVGDTKTIVVGNNAKDVFLPSEGNIGELELVSNSKTYLFAVKQSMLKQKSQQQAGKPEKLELGENISGVDYISVEIKHDNGETSVKGRVEPTDIGFVIYNENNNGKPFNIVWKEKLNKFVSGESMWYDEQDVVPTSGYEDAFSELKAS